MSEQSLLGLALTQRLFYLTDLYYCQRDTVCAKTCLKWALWELCSAKGAPIHSYPVRSLA